MAVETFSPRTGTTIAFERTAGASKTLPGVVFMGGFRSDMTGIKASHLQAQAARRHQDFLRFDYSGHGASARKFEDCTLSDWLQDSLDVFDTQTEGAQVVVGSSMGGWLALLLARQRAERMAGLVLLAPAPDFTEDVYTGKFGEEERRHLAQKGVIYIPSDYGDPYPLTQRLFEDGRKHLLLKDRIAVRCPVRLIHGKKDADVPWQKSRKIQDRLAAADSKITWVEDGDHRLSREKDLALIDQAVVELSHLHQQAAVAKERISDQ